MQGENALRRNFFCLAKRTFAPTLARPAKLPPLLPDSLHAPSIGGPVLHFAVCFLAFITVQEVFADEALLSSFSFSRSSPACAARCRSATCCCFSPHQGSPRAILGLVCPPRQRRRDSRGPNRSEISGIAGRFGSPCRTVLQYHLYPDLTARASDCRRE
jgi:hypothetical protein